MKRTYTDEFKQETVRLIESGAAVRQVARDLDVSEWTIRDWLRKSRGSTASSPARTLTIEEDNRRLREENRRLKLEREILKKATAFFASDPS